MFLRWISLGIAGFVAAGVFAGQAAEAQAQEKPPAAETGTQTKKKPAVRRTIRVRLVDSDKADEKKARGDRSADEDAEEKEEPGAVVVINGKEIAKDVEKAVSDAVSEAMDALGDIEANVRVEVDGKKLKIKSKQYRETLDEARERLKDLGDRLGEHAAEVEVRISRDKKADESADEAAEGVKEKRVIVIRDGDEAKIKIEKDKEGRTVVAIEGKDVKVITREKPGQDEKPDSRPE